MKKFSANQHLSLQPQPTLITLSRPSADYQVHPMILNEFKNEPQQNYFKKSIITRLHRSKTSYQITDRLFYQSTPKRFPSMKSIKLFSSKSLTSCFNLSTSKSNSLEKNKQFSLKQKCIGLKRSKTFQFLKFKNAFKENEND